MNRFDDDTRRIVEDIFDAYDDDFRILAGIDGIDDTAPPTRSIGDDRKPENCE